MLNSDTTNYHKSKVRLFWDYFPQDKKHQELEMSTSIKKDGIALSSVMEETATISTIEIANLRY